MRYAVVDTECTGLERISGDLKQPLSIAKSGSEVIEVGGLFLDERLQPVKIFKHYCDCMVPHSTAKAFATHHIELEHIRQHVSGIFLEEVVSLWLPEFLEDDILFIGYNTEFDMRMLVQSMRDFPRPFVMPKRMFVRPPRSGRFYMDVMSFLPRKERLSSFEDSLAPARSDFWMTWRGALVRESNCQGWSDAEWDVEQAHDAFFDALETYLLLMRDIVGKKVLF